ncbi:MAG: Na+/H+ antiporter subunit E [Deltaproteobacteria bacterium]|nr:Na+/H+ antiporter subunit E [Deltaproteobacteria bacterium]
MAFFFFLLLTGFAWMGLRGEVGIAAFLTGCVFGALAWRIEKARSRLRFAPARALRFSVAGARVLVLFLGELAIANWLQLRIVLAPRIEVHPQWISFYTELESPALRALLAVLICLTPGSITCEELLESDGRVRLFLHALDTTDAEALVARIRSRLEEPLRALELA